MKYSNEKQHIYKLKYPKKNVEFLSEFDTLLIFIDFQTKVTFF